MARHSIGEKVIVVYYEIDGLRGWLNPIYRPWCDKLKDVKFAALTVTEEHKVAWEHDTSEEKVYDGYVLIDVNGQRWGNQYPRYSQGQMTTADAYFERLIPTDAKFNDSMLSSYEDVCVVLDRIEDGIGVLAGVEKTKEMADQLRIHQQWLIKKLEREFGVKVMRVPVWEDAPDIFHTVLVWPEVK